jgi:ABC-type nickel/cobalt efflux system permease component RcnA
MLLWKRQRSTATAMIALGFAATLLSGACSLFMTLKTHAVMVDLTTATQASQDTFFIVAHYFPVLALGILGIWAAALGTLWHVRQNR